MVVDEEWLTVREAVKVSDLNAEYLTRLIREDKIKGRKVSTVWLVDRKSLLEYLGNVQALGKKRGPKSGN